MTKFFSAFLRDESGASAAEYALILALVGVGISVAAAALGDAVSAAMDTATDEICSDAKVGAQAGCPA